MWKIPKVWDGGTVIIIGGGPSILKQFDIPQELVNRVYKGRDQPNVYSPYLKPLHNQHVIAVNMAFKLGDWIDIVFFGDTGFWKAHKVDLLQFKGLRVSCANGDDQDMRIKYVKQITPNNPEHIKGICTKESMVCWNNNSGSAAINFAVHLGAKRIILLGFDMTLDGGNNQHWHKYYTSPLQTVKSTMKNHMKGFLDMAADLKRLGIECINANPDSKIEEFPRMNFKDIVL